MDMYAEVRIYKELIGYVAHERQNAIRDMVRRDGAVTITALVRFFDVSVETIRRDLLTMEQDGALVRVHGGAVAKTEMKSVCGLQQRHKEYKEQKYALSVKAAELVEEGDVIGVDSPTARPC